MQQSENALELKAEFTAIWSEFADEHGDDLTAGDWMHLFSVLMAIVMANTDLDDAGAQSTAEAVANLALEVREHINNGMFSSPHIQ